MIPRKAHQWRAIKTSIYAVSGLSEIWCVYEYPVQLESLAGPATMPNPPITVITVETLSHERIERAVSLVDIPMLR